MSKNPFLQKFSTPKESIPFSRIEVEHYLPAIEYFIKRGENTIRVIIESQEEPTFDNTILPFENLVPQLNYVVSCMMNLNHANTSEKLHQTVIKASPILTNFKNNLLFNERLFKRVKSVYEQREELNLDSTQKRLLENQYKAFVRNGVQLSNSKQKILRELDLKLAQLSVQFGKNVLTDTQNYQYLVTNKDLLDGVPEQILEMTSFKAREKGKDGWLLTLDYPIYIPIQKYCHNRDIRKKLAISFGQVGFQNNDYNNSDLVIQIVKLRKQRASILGYPSFNEYILEERMANSEKKVNQFLKELYDKVYLQAKKEWNQVTEFAKSELGIKKIEKWDVAYSSEALKKTLFNVDDEALKVYFPLQKVIAGLFKIAQKLYGLKFNQFKSIYQVYHNDVQVYEVFDHNDRFLALMYLDLHPREGKRSGAWMTNFKEQRGDNRPHISLVCNFPRPTSSSPSLLSFQDVRTLFHEFGHGLHSILSEVKYGSLSGTSVLWDFVELPSQIMENWCYQSEALKLFARHYKSGEPISDELIAKIKKSHNFQSGLQTLRQIGLGLLDLSYHQSDSDKITDIKSHELDVLSKTVFTDDEPSNCLSTSYAHIFQGGYASGYYGYKWAEVLDADAFELFLDKGIFNHQVAENFRRHILSQGNSDHPMELYKKFRGHEPKISPLIRRMGFKSDSA